MKKLQARRDQLKARCYRYHREPEKNVLNMLLTQEMRLNCLQWWSINDVTVQREGEGQRFCDYSTIAIDSNKKRDDEGMGIKNVQKLRDVIYGRPHQL